MGGRDSSSPKTNTKGRGSSATIEDYGLQHRPGNPLEYPDEVATIDKITNGEFFPKDFIDNAGMYLGDTDTKAGRETLETLRKVQNNPDAKVKIYRGAPSGGTLNTGDWVSLSKEYAEEYSGEGGYSDDKKSKVYTYTVKAKDLSFDGDSLQEFGYWGKKLQK